MLKVTTEPVEKCEVLMTVEVDDTRTDQLLKAAARRITTKVQIPGFRPGKAPYALVVRRVGEKTVRQQALDDLSESVFREALKEAKLEPYAPATMQDVTWDPLTMKVRVPLAPVVEIGDYRSLRLEVPPVEVAEADVDAALAQLQDERSAWKPVERPAAMGDKLAASARVRVGDQTVVDDNEASITLRERGEDARGPDLVTPLLGVSAGEERTFNVTYPDDFGQKELAGKDATVSVAVRAVQEQELYPLDDDFAQLVGDFNTLQELRDKVKADLLEQKQREADRELANQAYDKIAAGAPRVEWPSVVEEEAVDRWITNTERRMQREGMPLDEYLRTQQKTREQMREDARPQIQRQLRYMFVAQEFARRESLEVAPNEVMNYIEMMGNMAGDRRDEMLRAMTSEAGVRQSAQDLLDAKVRGRMVQIVKGELSEQPAEGEAKPAKRSRRKAKPEVAQVAADGEAPPKPKTTRRKPKAAAAEEA